MIHIQSFGCGVAFGGKGRFCGCTKLVWQFLPPSGVDMGGFISRDKFSAHVTANRIEITICPPFRLFHAQAARSPEHASALVGLLLSAGASVAVPNNRGSFPVHFCVFAEPEHEVRN